MPAFPQRETASAMTCPACARRVRDHYLAGFPERVGYAPLSFYDVRGPLLSL